MFAVSPPGLTTDLAKHRLSLRRVHFLSLVAFIMAFSQLVALHTDDAAHVWAISSTMGLAYGGLFGLSPVVALEWFGIGEFHLPYSVSRRLVLVYPGSSQKLI